MPDDDHGEHKRLFLLDGMALVYRAHFALIGSPRQTSTGMCTSAVFGFCNTLLDILTREDPTHLAVAFDTAEPTHRHEAFAEYKAQREAMPEELSAQLPYVFRLLEALRIPVLRVDGYEADDVLGTLARQAEPRGFHTFLVTPDKDFHQLVSDTTRIWKPGRQGSSFEILGIEQVLQRWGIRRADQVVDLLGLMGDASDNIPGVPGIGEKTARKLIAEFDSVENLLAHTGQLKGRQKERLETYAEQARLSKRLVTIVVDVPHGIAVDSLRRRPYDETALRSLFQELEFESLGRRLFGPDFTVGPASDAAPQPARDPAFPSMTSPDSVQLRTIREVPHDYRIVRSQSERAALLAELQRQAAICLDLETTGLNPRVAQPVGMAFCCRGQHAWYVVCPDEPRQLADLLDEFRGILADERIEKIGHNLKYDLTVLKWHGLEVRGRLFDTMLAHAMLEPEMKHGLDFLAQRYLAYRPVSAGDLLGPPGEQQRTMREVPVDQVAEYACEDADVTWQISQLLRPEIEQRGVSRVCFDVECPLVPVLVDMEYEGIRLDAAALRSFSEQLAHEIDELRGRIFAAAGHEFNPDSPRQLGQVLYDELQLDPAPKKTATGQYSTREADLLRLAVRHPLVRDVLEYRNAVKLKTVYVDQLPAAVDPRTGRVHTTYSQSWTATGRMQSNDPNLQTIPVRKQRGREIRAAFVPRDDDFLILSADYSQVELRIMAELSGDSAMLEAFDQGIDIHTATAAKVFKVALPEVTRAMRDKAKMVNFGIIYGISAYGLQQRLGVPRQEAAELIKSYFERYPGVRGYIDESVEFARQHGYVKTLTGRRRYIRDINSKNFSVRGAAERLAMNSPIQGTAADLLKLAMVKVHQMLREFRCQTRMLLTVHDEIVFDLYQPEQPSVLPRIESAMKTALPMKVPLVVEMGVGRNWLEAHS